MMEEQEVSFVYVHPSHFGATNQSVCDFQEDQNLQAYLNNVHL